MMGNILVMGLGNLLLADEGIGVHAARALIETELAEGVAVRDVGTAILDAIPDLEIADFVIVIDAVKADGEPGAVYRIPFNEMEHPETIASMHGFDLSRVLYLAGRKTFPEVLVIGVEPGLIDWGLDLTPPVAGALPAVVEQVMLEIAAYRERKASAGKPGIERRELGRRIN